MQRIKWSFLTRQTFEGEYANFVEPSDSNGYSMTGIVYRHESMGALTIGHYSFMNLENLNVQEEMSYNYDTMLHVYPTANMDYSVLTDEEKAILDKVIIKFKDYKAKKIRVF